MDTAASSPQRPFSWTPIIVINICNAVNMYTLVSLLPYAAFMTADFQGISVDEAGYLSGYLASSFTFGRTVSSYFWGWASDRFGRVPVLVWSMLSIATFSIAFGMSSSLWMAMGIRLTLGLTSSVMSTTRALTPELAGKERVVTAVSFFGGTRSLALMVGTCLGGVLSQPAKHFPSTFSSTGLFGRYPYLLPNLVGACFACIVIPLIIIFIPETKNLNGGRFYCGRRVRRGVNYYKPAEDDNDTDALGRKDAGKPKHLELEQEEGEGAPREPGVFGPGGLMSIPHIPALLIMSMIFSGCVIGLEELYPLWALSSRDAGGLEYSTVQIGKVLGSAAFGLLISQFFLYPRLVSWFGIATVQHVAGALSTLLPLLALNVALVTRDATSLMVLLIIILAIAHGVQASANVGMQLAGTNPVPPRLRGKLSGLFIMAQSIGRTIGPVLFATTFAWSISPEGRKLPLVDHRLPFTMAACLFGLVAVLGIRTLTTETMTHVADDPPESPYVEPSPRPRNMGDGATMSPYPERSDQAGSIVVGNRKADLV